MDALDERLPRLDGHGLLPHDRPGVEALVDEVDRDTRRGHPGRERLVDRARARELRQERRVHVDDPLAEAVEERRRQQVHVARADDQPHAPLLEPVRHRGVPLHAVVVVLERERGGGDARGRRPLERARVGPVGRDGAHGQPRVEQRLEVRALAADEHSDQVILPITSSPAASAAGTTAQ